MQSEICTWQNSTRGQKPPENALSGVNYHEFLALCSKYDIDVPSVSEHIIKKAVWNVFAQTFDI